MFSFLAFSLLYSGDLSCLFPIFLSKLHHVPWPQITWAGMRGVQMQERIAFHAALLLATFDYIGVRTTVIIMTYMSTDF